MNEKRSTIGRPESEVEASPVKSGASWFRILITTGLSTLLLVLLFVGTDAEAVLHQLGSVVLSGWILLVIFMSIFCNVFLSPQKWRLILDGLGHRIPYRTLVYLKLATDPIIVVLPMRSGELVRAWYLSRKHRVPLHESVGSIVLELGLTTASLVCLSLAGWIAMLAGSLVAGFVCAGSVTAAALLAVAPAGSLLLRILPKRPSGDSSLRGKLHGLLINMATIRFSTLTAIVSYSLLIELVEIVNVALIFKVLSIQVNFAALLTYIPIVAFVSRLPISLNGLGIRESSLILTLQGFSRATSGEMLVAGLMYSFVESIFITILSIPLTVHLLATFPVKRDSS